MIGGDRIQSWLGPGLEGSPIDHLPFGNRNLAALLASALLPLALLRRAWVPAAALGGLLWAADALGAFLGLLGGGALAWALGDPRRRRLLLPAGLAAAGLAFALGWTLTLRPPPGWRLHTSLGVRSLGWEEALRGWTDRPWTGHGAGSFGIREPELRDGLYARSAHWAPRMDHAYSLPLEALFETGIPGMLLCLGTLAAVLLGLGDPATRWICGTLLVQSLGGDALLDPIGLAAFGAAAGWGLGGGPPSGPPRPAPWMPLAAAAAALLLAAQASQAFWFAEGKDLERAGDWARAAASYAKASGAGIPSRLSMDARFRRGKCLMAGGRFEEALEAFRDLMARAGPYGNAERMAALAERLRRGRAGAGGSRPPRSPSGSR